MANNTLHDEISIVIEKLKERLSFDENKETFSFDSCLAKDIYQLQEYHEYLEEFTRLISNHIEFTLPSLPNLQEIFVRLEKQSVLSPFDFLSIFDLLDASERIYDLLSEKKEYFHLNDDALDLNPVVTLKRSISSMIESDGTVSDNASSKLRDVRSKIRETRRDLTNIMNTYRNRYSTFLSSDVIALKGGQEALPVKLSCKGSVKGATIGYSSTGETVFIVPYEVIDLQNHLSSLLQEEQDEIVKVLHDLSLKCQKSLPQLRRDNEILAKFDRFYASAQYGLSYDGTIASISEKELSLNALLHPLLRAKKVVTNSLTLGGKEPQAMLISGPNAGGKSILIKAVALSVYMDQLGLMIPCHQDSSIPFVKKVFFIGGDNQSVMDNLSTFSSHLLGIKTIIDSADENSLVIIDEVGEGTSPKDGEALGVALLKYFERLNCLTLLTSHFDGMKIYASSDPLAQIAAMEFDNSSLTPTYRLLVHTTGKSYGILLARQLGLKEEILKDAIAFQNERSNRDTDALMEKLTEQVSINEKKQRELDNKMKDLDRIIEKKQKAIDSLNQEKNAIKMKAAQKVDRLVEERIKEIDKIWEQKQSSGEMKYSEVSQAKGELNKIKTQEEKEPVLKSFPVLTDLKVGELVEDEDGRRGKILEVKKKEVLLDLDGLRIRRGISGLKRAKLTAKDVKVKKEYTSSIDTAYLNISPSQGMECNIIGMHVDEAMRKVVSFLDSSRLHHFTCVRIIHGAGTFALKNAVWKYLANHKEFVKDYRFGQEGEGGLGATVVHLK